MTADSKHKEWHDAFSAGACEALNVTCHTLGDVCDPAFLAAVEACGAERLMSYARRNKHPILPKLRKAMRDHLSAAAADTGEGSRG